MLYDQLSRDGSGSERELAAQVMVSLHRMESLTLNFLDLSKLETRGLRTTPRRVGLGRVVEDLLEVYRPAIELKGMRADAAVAPHLPAAWIDPLQTERCLANLLDNAVKFTPAGGTITVRVERDGAPLPVLIGDSGPGIAPEREATLFTRFQEGADSGGRRSTGLGLHIAHALVDAMDGDIVLDHAHGPGAWFRVRLPVAAEPALTAPPRETAHAA